MKLFLGPAQIIAILIAIAGLVVRQPAVAALGVVLWVGAVAVSSMRNSSLRQSGHESQQGRSLLQPIQKLHDEIAKLVSDNKQHATVSVIGNDALKESAELLRRASAFAALLHESRSAPKSMADAKRELEALERRLTASGDASQRESLALAVQARQEEVEHYERLIRTIEGAKQRLKDAEAALSAIKAQLAAAAVGGSTDGLDTEDLGGMVGRLKSLSASIEEVDEMREKTL
jgi:hypothetical protein